MKAQEIKTVKKFLKEGPGPQLIELSNEIFDLKELSGEEFKSSRLLKSYLEQAGYEVESGVGGMETAFRATYINGDGSGPSFGLLAEYDALERLGHGCAHHMQGPAILGAAEAIRQFGGHHNYKIVIYGTPAEETLGGKIVMADNGCFQDIDIALMMHGADSTCVDERCMALENFVVTFHGTSSHAAMNPDEGRSAFDAVLLSFNGIEFLREHVKDDTRMHYTVRDAGGAPNVVPNKAVGVYTLRSYDTDYLNEVVERFMNILKGAALMTDTTFEVQRDYPFKAKIPNFTLNDLVMEQAVQLGMPQITEPRKKTGSTDFGNVMYMVPGTCIRTAFVDQGIAAHSTEYVEAGKTARAHEAMLDAAVVLAGTCIDILNHPHILERIQNEFKEAKQQGKNQ